MAQICADVHCGDASSTKDPTMSRLEADKQRELWNDIARNRKKRGGPVPGQPEWRSVIRQDLENL